MVRKPVPGWVKLVRNSPARVGHARENFWVKLAGDDSLLETTGVGKARADGARPEPLPEGDRPAPVPPGPAPPRQVGAGTLKNS